MLDALVTRPVRAGASLAMAWPTGQSVTGTHVWPPSKVICNVP
jgi:hypothetical protein